MAVTAYNTNSWVMHHGNGRPLPIGTPVEVEMFCGKIAQIKVGGATHDPEGNPIDRSLGRWSAWDFNDGGPMGPKFKAYRLIASDERKERNTAMFRSWLVTQEPAIA